MKNHATWAPIFTIQLVRGLYWLCRVSVLAERQTLIVWSTEKDRYTSQQDEKTKANTEVDKSALNSSEGRKVIWLFNKDVYVDRFYLYANSTMPRSLGGIEVLKLNHWEWVLVKSHLKRLKTSSLRISVIKFTKRFGAFGRATISTFKPRWTAPWITIEPITKSIFVSFVGVRYTCVIFLAVVTFFDLCVPLQLLCYMVSPIQVGNLTFQVFLEIIAINEILIQEIEKHALEIVIIWEGPYKLSVFFVPRKLTL